MTDYPNKAVDESQKAVEQSTSTALDHLKNLTPYALFFTLFVAGAVLSTTYWSSTISKLQADLRRSAEEISGVKAEFADYRAKHPEKNADTIPLDDSLKVTLGVGSTVFVDDNHLLISVIAIQFESNPARYRITASLAAPGAATMKIVNVEVGAKFTFPDARSGSGNVFDIQLVDVNALSATFVVKAVK